MACFWGSDQLAAMDLEAYMIIVPPPFRIDRISPVTRRTCAEASRSPWGRCTRESELPTIRSHVDLPFLDSVKQRTRFWLRGLGLRIPR